MTERRFIALCFTLGVLIVLVGAGCARAAATDEARLGWFLPIARAAWPGSPCAGHEVIHLRADALLNADAPTFGALPSQLIGLTNPATCEIWIRSGLNADAFCTVLTHEMGHEAEGPTLQPPVDRFGHVHGPLDALGHTSVPGDIMNGDGDISWAPCDWAVTAAEHRGRSRAAMVHRSPLWRWHHPLRPRR